MNLYVNDWQWWLLYIVCVPVLTIIAFLNHTAMLTFMGSTFAAGIILSITGK